MTTVPTGIPVRTSAYVPAGMIIRAKGELWADALTAFKLTHEGRPPFWTRYDGVRR